ncbi:hypothetical protein [Mycobacteroides abscessus]|uniref:hypothetical protein n=1 Tax=Mycobacteroides abscessus TaxID=36809 RepID=UPI000C266278|nr:hypothetical protein [Mycobacteroides abscessus]
MMVATVREISKWFDTGVAAGAAYMVVWCDTYDYNDYPSYYPSAAEAQAALDATGKNMQSAMECYDLNAPKEPQLSARRTWALAPQ